MKQYSFLSESLLSITQDKESFISNNIVYHGSQDKMDIIKGNKTNDKRFGYGCVFVTPFKYYAAHFIFDSKILYTEICKRYPEIKKIKLQRMVWGYRTLGLKHMNVKNPSTRKMIETTYPKESVVDVVMKDTNEKPVFFKDFKCEFTGYVHYIDYNEYKDKAFQDNESCYEFVIKGNVKPFKIEKVTVKFLVKYWDGVKDKKQ